MPFPARECKKMHCICISHGEHRAGRHWHARQRGSRIGNRLHTLVIHIVSASSPLCMKQGLPRILPFIAVCHHLISLRKVVWFSHASEEEPRGRKSSIEIPGISAEHIPLSLSPRKDALIRPMRCAMPAPCVDSRLAKFCPRLWHNLEDQSLLRGAPGNHSRRARSNLSGNGRQDVFLLSSLTFFVGVLSLGAIPLAPWRE